VSSAILYFAIVAIWAGVLMPKWLRPSRSHRNRTDGDQPAETVTEFAQPAPEAMVAEREPDRPSRPERRERSERRAAGRDEAPGGHPEADRHETERRGADRGEADRREAERREAERREAERREAERREAERREAERREAERPAAWSPGEAGERRANIRRARRRMLGTLILLTAGAVAIAVTHVAAWWVIIPPGALLAGFLLLLRETGRSDAERAHRHADLTTQRPRAERESRALPAAPAMAGPDRVEVVAEVVETEFSAKIIDISARVTDQLYDQYTDAAERAVGD
jgi:hypothetical protein